jgi:hypothetical protein
LSALYEIRPVVPSFIFILYPFCYTWDITGYPRYCQ